MIRRIAFVPALLLAGACVPTIRPLPPSASVPLPDRWRGTAAPEGEISQGWWRAFGDAILDAQVERALVNNTDALTAISKVAQAQAALRLARAALIPTIDGDGSATTARAMGKDTTTFTGNLDVSWEADLFGRLRAEKRAARYEYAASRADRDGVALSVASQVAQAHIMLAALDAQLVVTQQTLVTRQTSLTLAEDQLRLGYTSQFELTQAQGEYESVRAQIPELERGIRAAEISLQILTGDTPSSPAARARIDALTVPTVPSLMASTLLERRPDVASAEYMLRAADATLASMRAAFLPSVEISGSLGQLLVNATGYNPMKIWSLGGSILAPIFEGGKLRANFDAASAQRDQAAFAYKAAVLTAFGDVETALSDVHRYAEEVEINRRQRAILARSLDLAQDRYRSGYSTYLDQLDAQRGLYTAQLADVTLRQKELQATVQLYAAFGGGFVGDIAHRVPGGG